MPDSGTHGTSSVPWRNFPAIGQAAGRRPRVGSARAHPSLRSLVPVLTSIPLAPFPTMVAVGWGLWSPRLQSQALPPAPFRPQTSRAVERAESRVRI